MQALLCICVDGVALHGWCGPAWTRLYLCKGWLVLSVCLVCVCAYHAHVCVRLASDEVRTRKPRCAPHICACTCARGWLLTKCVRVSPVVHTMLYPCRETKVTGTRAVLLSLAPT